MNDQNLHPDFDFDQGVLHLTNLGGFDEVDVLAYDTPKAGDIRPLVVGGRIEAGAFSCAALATHGDPRWPLSFLIRLGSRAGNVQYVQVSVNDGDNLLTISAVTR